MINDILKTLKTFGLSEKQAKIYLALLELGASTAQKISHKSELPRATVYDILSELAEMGAVALFEQKGVKNYSAENPEKLLKLAQDKTRLLEGVLPQLQALYKSDSDRPMVRFFQGREGMKAVLEEVLQDRQEMMSFSSADDLFSILDDYFPQFVVRRVALKIPARVILRDTPRGRERKKLGDKELRQVRLVPATYDWHAMKSIFGKKVAYFAFDRDLLAVVIESEVLSKLEKAQFDLLWKLLPVD